MNNPFTEQDMKYLESLKSSITQYRPPVFLKGTNTDQITITFSITDPLKADLFLSNLYNETFNKEPDSFCNIIGLKIKEIGCPGINAFDALRTIDEIRGHVKEYEEIIRSR